VVGKKFIDKTVKHVEAAKRDLSKKFNGAVKNAVDKMGLITRKEVKVLKEELRRFKKQLSKFNSPSKKSKKRRSNFSKPKAFGMYIFHAEGFFIYVFLLPLAEKPFLTSRLVDSGSLSRQEAMRSGLLLLRLLQRQLA